MLAAKSKLILGLVAAVVCSVFSTAAAGLEAMEIDVDAGGSGRDLKGLRLPPGSFEPADGGGFDVDDQASRLEPLELADHGRSLLHGCHDAR